MTLVLRKMRAGYRLAKDATPINHLLFMDDLKLYGANKDQLDSLIQVVRIFSQDIKMSFGLEKCAVLEIRRGRQVDSSGIDLPDDQHIGEIGEEGYKYLGILQLDQNLNTKMKVKITSEYIRRVKKLCRSKIEWRKFDWWYQYLGCRRSSLQCGGGGLDHGGNDQHG